VIVDDVDDDDNDCGGGDELAGMHMGRTPIIRPNLLRVYANFHISRCAKYTHIF
jgi:hypothetical protein